MNKERTEHYHQEQLMEMALEKTPFEVLVEESAQRTATIFMDNIKEKMNEIIPSSAARECALMALKDDAMLYCREQLNIPQGNPDRDEVHVETQKCGAVCNDVENC